MFLHLYHSGHFLEMLSWKINLKMKIFIQWYIFFQNGWWKICQSFNEKFELFEFQSASTVRDYAGLLCILYRDAGRKCCHHSQTSRVQSPLNLFHTCCNMLLTGLHHSPVLSQLQICRHLPPPSVMAILT